MSPDLSASECVASTTEAAIQADDRLSKEQKRALLAVYQSYVSAGPSGDKQGSPAHVSVREL